MANVTGPFGDGHAIPGAGPDLFKIPFRARGFCPTLDASLRRKTDEEWKNRDSLLTALTGWLPEPVLLASKAHSRRHPVVTTECAHQVQFYGSDDVLGLNVAGHLAVPLLRGEAAVVIATAEHRAMVAAELAVSGIDVPALRLAERYLELDAAKTLALFMTDAGPDESRFREAVSSMIDRAVDRFGAVAAYGEMVGLLAADGQLVAALELESLWTALISESRLRLLCGYPTEHVAAGASYESVCAVHDAVSAPRSLSAAIDLPLGAEASALARRAAVSVCRVWGVTDPEWIDDVGLVVAELVGNAVRHSASPVALSLDAHDNRITVSVTDGSQAMPLPRTGDELAEDGRGFSIIDALSEAWGVERHPSGKRVWAQLRSHHGELVHPAKP
jgi:anti-sigma regulatory factor (Ser/Thr protein kinase)